MGHAQRGVDLIALPPRAPAGADEGQQKDHFGVILNYRVTIPVVHNVVIPFGSNINRSNSGWEKSSASVLWIWRLVPNPEVVGMLNYNLSFDVNKISQRTLMATL